MTFLARTFSNNVRLSRETRSKWRGTNLNFTNSSAKAWRFAKAFLCALPCFFSAAIASSLSHVI